MSLTLAALALATPTAPAFQQSSDDPGTEAGRLAHELRLAPGEELLEYSWDERGSVPFARPAARVRLEYGERGLQAATLLYLPANSLAEAPLTGASVQTALDLALTEGRYGSALALLPSSYLHVTLPQRPLPQGGWTLSFWIKPEAGAFGRGLLLLGGAADLALQADGRVRVTLAGGPSLFSTNALGLARWSFVQVAYDPAQTRQLRLLVDGQASGLLLAPGQPARVPGELKLGDLGRGGTGFRGALDEFALEAGPSSTAAALERAEPAVTPGLHELFLQTTQRARRARAGAALLHARELGSAADFARGTLTGAAVVGDELHWAPARWTRLDTLDAPAPRTTHPLVSLGDGRAFLFGGEIRDTHVWPMVNTSDTWIFERATQTWSFVPTSVAPGPRCHMPVAYSPEHDVVLLHGGWRNDLTPTQLYDDTWLFRVAQRRWEQVFPPSPRPGAISDHGLLFLPARHEFLLLARDVAWTFDPVSVRWQFLGNPRVIDEAGQPASFQFGASTACVLDPSTGLVVLYGGSYGNPPTVFTDTTVLYDVSSNTYRVLAPPLAPPARVRGGFGFDPRLGRVLLFGGVQDQFSVRQDDLWAFDPRTRTWSELLASNAPGRRGGYYGMPFDETTGRFLLACGRETHDRWLDETWELELAPTRPGVARYLFEREPTDLARAWFADVLTPADSAVNFFLRQGDSLEQLGPWQPAGAVPTRQRFVELGVLLTPGSAGETPLVRACGFR